MSNFSDIIDNSVASIQNIAMELSDMERAAYTLGMTETGQKFRLMSMDLHTHANAVNDASSKEILDRFNEQEQATKNMIYK